jgi:PAS domain S-box-containing protein
METFKEEMEKKDMNLNRTLELLGKLTVELNEREEKLKESESSLTAILSAAPIGIARVEDRIFKWINDTLSSLSGYKKDELRNQSSQILFFTEEEFRRAGEALYTQHWVETKMKRKDGTCLDIYLELARIQDTDSYIVTITDISRLKKSEEQLRQRTDELQLTFEYVPIGIATIYMDGNFRSVNPTFCNMIGYTEEELQKLSYDNVSYYEDYAISKEHLEKLKKGLCKTTSYNKRYLHKNGTIIYANVTAGVVYSPNKEPIFVTAITEDISKRLEEEKILKESEALYRALVENSYDAILIVDSERKILSCNKSFLDGFKFCDKSDVLGKPFRILYPSDETYQECKEKYLDVINTKGHSRYSCTMITQENETVELELTVSRIMTEFGLTGALIIFRRKNEEDRNGEEICFVQKGREDGI